MHVPAIVARQVRRVFRTWVLRSAKNQSSPDVTVRGHGWNKVEFYEHLGQRRTQYSLDESGARLVRQTGTIKITMPDATSFARLVVSGILSGKADAIDLKLDNVPEWLITAARLPRLGRQVDSFALSREGSSLNISITWSRPEGIHRGLSFLLGIVLRSRLWDQVNGPVFAVDRSVWLKGQSTWPQAIIAARCPDDRTDDNGRPVGPYRAPSLVEEGDWSIVSSTSNPYGRVLQGHASTFVLATDGDRLTLRDGRGAVDIVLDVSNSPDAVFIEGNVPKYSVVQVDGPLPSTPFASYVLRALGASGTVFASPDKRVREQLDSWNLVVVTESSLVDDLPGYLLSTSASRKMAIHGDAALRQTSLAGRSTLGLPSVSAVISSKRPDDVFTCLQYLGAQTYPSLEVVIGTHGYHLEENLRAKIGAVLNCPFKVEFIPESRTLGENLGHLTTIADGELLTKLDDDDHYGPNHVTDLVLAWHQTGADMVAKGARFVYLPDHGKTIDRAWAAPEQFNVQPAGGTLLIGRSALYEVGGWSTSSFHVDADLITRIRTLGGITYRTHSLEYGYVRRTNGHTWSAELNKIMEQGERTYDGLPDSILGTRPILRSPALKA